MISLMQINHPNDAWIFHRESIYTEQDGKVHAYFLLDAHSAYCFDQELNLKLPSKAKFKKILNKAQTENKVSPKMILISQDDPCLKSLREVCSGLSLNFLDVPSEDLGTYLLPFKEAFGAFQKPKNDLMTDEFDSMPASKSLLPDNYAGDREFETFLVENDIPISVWEIRSFVMGVLLGPEFLQPSWVLEELLLHDTEDEIQFESEDEFQNFMKRFFGLWNELASYRETIKTFKLSPTPVTFQVDDCIPALGLRLTEIDTFLAGIYESGGSEVENESSKLKNAFEELESSVECLQAFIVDIDEENNAQIKIDRTKKMLDEVDQTWDRNFKIIATSLKELRR